MTGLMSSTPLDFIRVEAALPSLRARCITASAVAFERSRRENISNLRRTLVETDARQMETDGDRQPKNGGHIAEERTLYWNSARNLSLHGRKELAKK